jgi:putative FmdB family regulatory protein
MIVYEFRCDVCDYVMESEDKMAKLTHCNQKMLRVFSLGGVQFKGDGFYKNDKG